LRRRRRARLYGFQAAVARPPFKAESATPAARRNGDAAQRTIR